MTRLLQLALFVAVAIVAPFALQALRAPPLASPAAAIPRAPRSSATAPDLEMAPDGSAIALLIGGGYDPESNQVSIEDDLLEAASFFPRRARVLYAGGGQTQAVQVANRDQYVDTDDLERRLGDLFSPRAHRDAHFVPTRLPRASELSRAAIGNSIANIDEHADQLFLYFTGHGSNDGDGSLFHLWGDDAWSVDDMQQWMLSVHERAPGAQLQLLVTSCYGGDFVRVAELGFACAGSATTSDRESSGCDPNQDRNAQEGFGKAFWRFVQAQSTEGAVPSLGAALRYVRANASSIDVPVLSSEMFSIENYESHYELDGVEEPLGGDYASIEDTLLACHRHRIELDGLAELALEELQNRSYEDRCITIIDHDWQEALKDLHDSLEAMERQSDQELAQFDTRTAELRAALLALYPVLDDPWHPLYQETLSRNRADIQRRIESAPNAPELADVAQQDAMLLRSALLERAELLSRVMRAEILWHPTPQQSAQLTQLRQCEDTPLPVTTLTPQQ